MHPPERGACRVEDGSMTPRTRRASGRPDRRRSGRRTGRPTPTCSAGSPTAATRRRSSCSSGGTPGWRPPGVCRGVVRDHHAAEDVTQAAFLALARKAGSIGRRDAVAGWLYVERITAVEWTDQDAFDNEADDRRQGRGDQQPAPEADIGRDRIGDIAADNEKSAMSEIDDVAQVENERQAERHEHVERADDQPIRDVEEQKLGHDTLGNEG